MNNISLFKNFTKEVGQRSLTQIVDGIRGDHYRESVLRIRELVKAKDKKKANQLKKGLVAFTVSGLFEGGRKMPFLKTYNPFVILDIDKLDPGKLPGLILKIKQIDFTRVVFISPSGRGLKIIVEVNSDMKKHKAAYWQVMNYYKDYLMVEIDKSGSDITRLCFMSYDPDVYFNPKSSVYEILESEVETTQSANVIPNLTGHRAPAILDKSANLKVNYTDAFARCVERTDGEMVFEEGNRNNYIYKLGAYCSHAGIPLEITVEESKRKFDFDSYELERTIKSAYSWQPFSTEKASVASPSDDTGIIPMEVFDNLPGILKKGCEPWKDKRERDIFFTGALGVLSGLLPKVKGIYDDAEYFPNLNVFVVAPSASGKSAIRFAKILGLKYHGELIEKRKKGQVDYNEALLIYKKERRKYLNGTTVVQPEKPKRQYFKTLFLPADSTSAVLMSYLEHNEDGGILFESDSETLSKIFKRGRVSYSNLLLKAFDHDSICWSEKKGTEYVEIERTRLSSVLSGTLDQAKKLIPSKEGNLFCDFIYYTFKIKPVWRDVSRKGKGQNFTTIYQDLSKEVLEMVHFLKAYPTEFKLREEQWKRLDEVFRDMMEETGQHHGREAGSIVRRMGLICFRIAMILSALRKFEQRSKQTELVCKNQDFKVAICLAKIYWKHAVSM